MLTKFIGACVQKSKTTAAKVGGSAVGVGGIVSLVLFLHGDIKAEINEKLALVETATNAKVETVATVIASNDQKNQAQFKAVQQTIDLQVQVVGEKMKSVSKGQSQILKALEKLDQRLYQMKNGGG